MKTLLNMCAIMFLASCAASCSSVQAGEKPHMHPKPKPPENVVKTTCGAENLQYLVGKDRSVLQTMRFGSTVRIEEPGRGYTMDYRENRTRIQIGEDGKIHRVICG